ncbi:TPA: hypothetical protein DCZ39_06425, partial [Patescibacteria group bacterium]|nr:hypothetical protein [Candidatus Gracilibacteria bacterium]
SETYFWSAKSMQNHFPDAVLRTNIPTTHDLVTHLKPHKGGSPFRLVVVGCFIYELLTISWHASGGDYVKKNLSVDC